MQKFLLVFILFFVVFGLQTKYSFAQQNCMDAIPICQNSYNQTAANTGIGSTNDLSTSSQGCLGTGEINSSWYILNTSTAGNVVFTITPNNTADDYDFAVWDITDTSCTALSAGLSPIRCNYTSAANTGSSGQTGLNTSATQTTVGGGGPPFSSAITASAGQTFIILINNNTGSANGYNLKFTGSTAQIIDNTAPQVKNIIVPATCGGPSQVKILLKENVKCSSIAANGSDFGITGGYSISNAVGNSCVSGGLFSSAVTITFNTILAPGNYTVTFNTGTDGNTLVDNCNNTMAAGTTFTFTVLPPVKVQVQPQFGCGGGTNGSITASGTGGYLPYKYKLNNGTYNLGNTFSSLSAGTYTIFIKDSLGCIDDTIITLSPAPPIIINGASSSNLSCFSSANGSITINSSGGNAPLQYAVNSVGYSASNVITGLGPGTYVVHTKDANGCIKDTILLITSPGQLIGLTVNISNVTCIGLTNGIINYTGNGGTPPLQYSLNTGSYSSFANYTGLAAGSYTLHIKDANNCTKDTTIIITQPTSILTANVTSVIQPNCSGTTGTIAGVGSGGTSPYSYSINGTTYNATNSFTGLSSGSYTIYVKDAGGCVATVTSILTSPGNVQIISSSVIQPTCVTAGSITITGSGGAGILSYANGVGTYSGINNFTGLAAGSYTLHVKDVNNCIHDTIINLVQPPNPQIAISTIANATCSSPNSGSLVVSSVGGTGLKTYSLNGGAFGAAASFTSLAASNYTIVVKDANGCTSFTTTTIATNNTIAFASVVATNVSCSGNPLGTITVSGVGGNVPYQFKLNNGSLQASGNFINLAGGIYTLTVQDASGCSKTTAVTINSSAGFSIASFVKNNATCSNPGNGTLTVAITGGVPAIVYNLNGTNYAVGNYSNLPPGTYTFTATDANGCSISSTTVITGPPLLYFTNTTVVLPPCYGGIGSINTSGIGGTPGYTFSVNNNPYQSTGAFPNLTAGNYTVHVKDNNGCIHDTIINLIQPNPVVSSNLSIVNAACNGNPTGSISVTGGGTAGPYLYSINGGAFSSNSTFNNLAVGNYTIVIKDANTCTGNVLASINNNGNFYFGVSNIVIPTCVGGSNGSITFSGSGGTMPYTYSINSGTYQASNSFTGLTAGNITLNVKDALGCIVNQVATINNPTPIVFTSVVKNSPLCFNGNNGSVTITASGGTGMLTYKINGGAFSSSTTFTNLTATTHTVTIKDANGCLKDSIISVVNPAALQFGNVTTVNPGCFGPGSGSITILANGGQGPYSYQLNNGGFSTTTFYPSLNASTYTIYAKDANNCTNSSTVILNTVAGASIAQVVKVFPQCANSSNGSITVTGSSANTPITYTINNGAIQTNGSFAGLGAGTFSIHVVDALGCFKDTLITLLTQSNLKIDSAKTTPTLCFGDSTGKMKIFGSGGNGSYTYGYNNLPYQSSNTFNNLPAGIYTLHIKDAIGCIKDTIISVGSPAPLIFSSANIIPPFCNGSQDGGITIAAAGGSGPYLYKINANPFSTTTSYTNLIQSVYTFQIKDANNCLHDTTIFLQGPDIISFSNFTLQNITCFGASDGSIAATATGGLPTYQYSLNNNAFSGINTFTSLPSGSYTLIIKDNQGCIKDTIVQVTAPTTNVALQIISVTNNKCRGDSTGSVTIGGTGGTSPFTFKFGTATNYSSTTTFNNLYAGNFFVSIKDANGCSIDSSLVVTEPDSSALIFLIGTSKNSCIGVYDASILVSTKNGFRPYTYFINSVSNGTDSTFTNLVPGSYVVDVIDSIGCKSSGKYFVDSSKQEPFIIINNVQNNVCKYDSIGIASWTYQTVYNPVTVFLNGGNIGVTNSISQLPNGIYTLQILDNKGCATDTTFSISKSDSLEISVSVTEASCSGSGNDGKVKATSTQGFGPYTYQWTIPNSANTDSLSQVNFGSYNLQVIDAKGCIDTVNFIVPYYPCCGFWMPNAFTPNGDIHNNRLEIKPGGPVVFESIQIFNRYGNKIFETKNVNESWDGTYQGKNCDIDTYYYLLRYKCPLKEGIIQRKGDITLIR